ETVEIMVYRESRGGEVRHDFFRNQFDGARLTEQYSLDRNIDGISGATLSVNAVTAVTRWALYLHEQVTP
ncbi:MAG: FMN-binding protein, partial [Gammaproteobacteria bacterium]|nr:FMN-binding protein [Gammaproteobacteria bacterium]